MYELLFFIVGIKEPILKVKYSCKLFKTATQWISVVIHLS